MLRPSLDSCLSGFFNSPISLAVMSAVVFLLESILFCCLHPKWSVLVGSTAGLERKAHFVLHLIQLPEGFHEGVGRSGFSKQPGLSANFRCAPELQSSLQWVSDALPREKRCHYFHLADDETEAQRKAVCQVCWQCRGE